ncbi:hypothetical protein ISN45_Aa01g028810 [Arabidopsis thaliana x Arabidopsis arenosa]|uniref:Uncharacterized protein n=1 Tax=Arabidopsis thaliana x Arabidopsis arenosa TaxID=1240361 RepID=A0A8T2CFW3_9BRAS|nr:hypothetical protein ISN45_Aa01g028810 [Arabidopsis thaliana x Arabidopsis arenosa]
MSSPAVYVSDNEDDSQGIPVPSGNEVCTQRGEKFGPHFRSQSTHASLGALRCLCNIPQEIESLSLNPTSLRKQCEKVTVVLTKSISKGETNWNSFTLQCIHDAGLAIKNGQTLPLDPPPEEKDVSSLNARDKRKILAETKALKDQLSEIGKKKRIAAISKVGNFHRKTLLVDDGSLEAALSMAVDTHGAEIRPSSRYRYLPFCTREREREVTSSPHTKRKVPDSDTLSNEKLKTVRFSSSLQAPSPSHSVLPSSEPLDPELPLPSDRAIPEEVAELRSEVPPSQGLGVSTQNPSPASISETGGEEIGDIFRSFQTRAGAFLPPFSVWRPNIRQMYVNRACYLSQAKKEIDELKSVNQPDRLEQAKTFESSFEDMRKTLAANEQRLRIANAERDYARSDALRLKAELEEATALSEEASHKADFLVKTRAREIAEAEHNAREEIRELENGRVSFENERREVTAELAVVESELSSASRPILDLKQFSLVFGESSSQFEIGEGSRQNEDSPEIVDKMFVQQIVGRPKALCDKRQRIGRRHHALDERIRRMEREIHRLESEPHEWEKKGLDIVAIIPTCLQRFLRVLDKLLHLSLATSDGSSFVSCSSEFRRFPMLRTEENEEPEMKSTDHSSGLLDLSSDEGLSSESCSGSSTSLESLSGEDFLFLFVTCNSSENPSDSLKMISGDLPGTSDIELVKMEGTGEPEESRTLGWGTSIQVPIVLIERLSAQDRVKAEEFINKLITRHNELEGEKIEIRKRRMELEKRRLDIACELHRLEAHPSDWIETGLQEYGNMPGRILSIVDLAGQGAELFHNPRPF